MKSEIRLNQETGATLFIFEVDAGEFTLPKTEAEAAVLAIEAKNPSDTYRQLGVLIQSADRDHYARVKGQRQRPLLVLPTGAGVP